MKRALAAALCVACGARTDLGGVLRDAAPAEDAAPHGDAGPCDWTQPFTSIAAIAELNAGGSAELRLSQDELTGYFYRGGDIFVTHRASIGAPFAAPALATDVSSPAFDADPFLSADGLTLYLNTNRKGTLGDSDIFVANRPIVSTSFSPPAPLANVDSTAYDGTPYVTNDGRELWIASSRDGSIHLYRAGAQPNGFAQAQPVSELNGPSSVENNPVLTADGLTVYFSSNRGGATEIYVAHRTKMASAFSTPKIASELSSGSDYASWISPDGCRLYMTRGAGAGFALYVATR